MANPQNIEKYKMKKGETLNPNGRPKKLYSNHIEDVKKKGYEAPNRTEYFEMIGLLLAMTEEDLKTFSQDKDRPYWIRLIIIDMNSKNTRQKMMSDYRDWLFGRASQSMDVTSKGDKINVSVIEIGGSKIEIEEK